MEKERRHAQVIDLCVRQRMLAQKVVILAFAADRSPLPEAREKASVEMQEVITALLTVHVRLTSLYAGDLTPPGTESWREFVAHLDEFVQASRIVANQAHLGRPLPRALVSQFSEPGGLDFLSGLDALIHYHQRLSKADLALLDRLQRMFLIGTLAMLGFMGVVLFRPLINDIVSDRLELETANTELARLATADCLTGLFNRRKFDEIIAREMELARRYADRLSLLMFDIDHFKAVNDTLGHAVGDQVLAELGGLTLKSVRSVDYVFRWGGEEFMILASRTGEGEAFAVAEKLRGIVAEHAFPGETQVTISLGVAEYRRGERLDDWLNRVDQAMYAAKRGGRNKTVAA